MDLTSQIETAVRLGCFVMAGVVLVLSERLWPRRRFGLGRRRRWPVNFGLVTFNAVSARVLFPVAAVGASVWATEAGVGLFPWVNAPVVVSFVGTVVLMDLSIYLQHRVFHRVPLFWRFHAVHHADLEFDATTGLRFHTVSILFSMCWKMMTAVLIGASPWGVVVAETALNVTAMFNHSNIAIPGPVDRVLRVLLVTPDMHRVHHSLRNDEMNHNFGFNFPWWDYLFRTYRPQPAEGHEAMAIGLPRSQLRTQLSFLQTLLMPFRSEYQMGRLRKD